MLLLLLFFFWPFGLCPKNVTSSYLFSILYFDMKSKNRHSKLLKSTLSLVGFECFQSLVEFIRQDGRSIEACQRAGPDAEVFVDK